MDIKSKEVEQDNFIPVKFVLTVESRDELRWLVNGLHLGLNANNKEYIEPLMYEFRKYL